MALIKVKTGGVDSTVNFGRRNMIINGAMQVAQRYGYNSAQTDWNDYDASDRMFKRTSGGSTSSVQTRNDDAPSGFTYSDKLTITSQNSDTYIGRGTSLEWNDISHLRAGYSDAKTITLSFWVKASISGTYCFAYTSYVALHSSGDAATSYVTEYTVNSANTWEYKTISIPADTAGNIDNDNGPAVSLIWWLNSGSTYSSGSTQTSWSTYSAADSNAANLGVGGATSDYIAITGVQLEVGSVATEFERRPYGTELQLCQRYYQRYGYPDSFINTSQVVWVDATTFGYFITFDTDDGLMTHPLPVRMRATPSASITESYISLNNQTQSFTSGNTLQLNSSTVTHASFHIDTNDGITTPMFAVSFSNANGYYDLSAEL